MNDQNIVKMSKKGRPIEPGRDFFSENHGSVNAAWYLCASCNIFGHTFLFRIADDNMSIMKVGQYPPQSIEHEADIKDALGIHIDLYTKGLICELQGYGIAAFAYYRRIVENVITKLLDDIADLIKDEAEHGEYLDKLDEVRDENSADVRIGVVKDLLPPILRPNNTNPLSDLHSAFSQGLHAESDEECLDLAESTRLSLVFLVRMVTRTKRDAADYTSQIEAIKKKLEKRKRRTEPPTKSKPPS